MVDELEGAGVLESPRIAALRKRLIEDYAALEVRPAFHAGRAYPSGRGELEAFLDDIMAPGRAGAPARPAGPVRALIAPHIDLEAGRRAYASAYGALRGHPSPRRVLLLGTGHGLGSELFSLTEKDFETPLGRVRTDKAAVRRVRASAGPAAATDDLGHRTEHSIEFQLIFLQRLFGSEFNLLPVLCGSFREELRSRRRAAEIPGAQGVLALMKEYALGSGSDSLVVAGVDLSHIGPKFGHDLSAAALSAETRRHDRNLLKALCRVEAEAFWEEIRAAGDRYNVCGFSALACLLEILPAAGLRGRLLDYDLRREAATRSAVSFASVAFHPLDESRPREENER